MSIFNKVRKLVSKRRRPPRRQPRRPQNNRPQPQDNPDTTATLIKGSEADMRLLQWIKYHLQLGRTVTLYPADPLRQVLDRMAYENAKELKEVEGWNELETLIETGFWIED